MDPLGIGCPTSTVYDIVGFLSVTQGVVNQKLVLATKVRKRWLISSTQKMIGEGEELCQLFSRSQIIILECVRTSSTNFLLAVAECCSTSIAINDQNIDTNYKTLRDAIKKIEETPSLQCLKDTLSSDITNYYQCPKCNVPVNSLMSTYDRICIYAQITDESIITALPFIRDTDSCKLQCSNCKQSMDDWILTTYEQTHQRCPFTLMFHSRRIRRDQVTNLRIKLIDNHTQLPRTYHIVSLLLVDEYSSISLIKVDGSNTLKAYCRSPYITPSLLSDIEIDDLFTTARSNILFCQSVS